MAMCRPPRCAGGVRDLVFIPSLVVPALTPAMPVVSTVEIPLTGRVQSLAPCRDTVTLTGTLRVLTDASFHMDLKDLASVRIA